MFFSILKKVTNAVVAFECEFFCDLAYLLTIIKKATACKKFKIGDIIEKYWINHWC